MKIKRIAWFHFSLFGVCLFVFFAGEGGGGRGGGEAKGGGGGGGLRFKV